MKGVRGYQIDKKNKIFTKSFLKKKERGRIVLKKEYNNLKFLHTKKLSANFIFATPLEYDESIPSLSTRYVEGKNLVDVNDSTILFSFGKELKLFHEKDNLTHGELELQDVLFVNKKFLLVDLGSLNKTSKEKDYSRFKISIMLYQMKKPRKFLIYSNFLKAFDEGYKPRNMQSYVKEEFNSIISSYWKKGFKMRFKAIIIFLFIKFRI